jgi:hypothetical protein
MYGSLLAPVVVLYMGTFGSPVAWLIIRAKIVTAVNFVVIFAVITGRFGANPFSGGESAFLRSRSHGARAAELCSVSLGAVFPVPDEAYE